MKNWAKVSMACSDPSGFDHEGNEGIFGHGHLMKGEVSIRDNVLGSTNGGY